MASATLRCNAIWVVNDCKEPLEHQIKNHMLVGILKSTTHSKIPAPAYGISFSNRGRYCLCGGTTTNDQHYKGETSGM